MGTADEAFRELNSSPFSSVPFNRGAVGVGRILVPGVSVIGKPLNQVSSLISEMSVKKSITVPSCNTDQGVSRECEHKGFEIKAKPEINAQRE